MKARLENLLFDRDGGCQLTVSTREDISELYDDLRDCDVSVTIKKHRANRGLTANALYWVYVAELAKVLGRSNAAIHNTMLRKYGFPEMFGDKIAYIMLPDTDEAAQKALEAETYHLKPTSQTRPGKDGETYRAYMLMRGSSTYDTAEFSRLLDGLITDCQDAGMHIQTDRSEYD